ncbi:hypothetical protein GF374_02095 [Candidatus Woesearchaeota archaeon]|nr:hypothetical protein [Candidatus Woesearchaeota archaeon]
MTSKKQTFEFVKLKDPNIVHANLKEAAIVFNDSMQKVEAELENIQEKHNDINQSKTLTKSILLDAKKLNADLLKKYFKSELKAKKEEEIVSEPKKVEIKEISSRQALKNLKNNLSELKKVLRK